MQPICAASSSPSYLFLLKFQISEMAIFTYPAIFWSVSLFSIFWIFFNFVKLSKNKFLLKILRYRNFEKCSGLEIGSDGVNGSSTSDQNRRISIYVQTWVSFMENIQLVGKIIQLDLVNNIKEVILESHGCSVFRCCWCVVGKYMTNIFDGCDVDKVCH